MQTKQSSSYVVKSQETVQISASESCPDVTLINL